MLSFDGSVYLFSGTVSLFLGIILLSVKRIGEGYGCDYLKIRRFIAYSAFIDVLIDILIICFQIKNADYFFLDYLVIPVCYLVQISLITLTLLRILNSSIDYDRKIRKMLFPVGILVVTYIFTYLYLVESEVLSPENYAIYAKGHILSFMSQLLYVLIIGVLAVYIYWLAIGLSLFKSRVNSYYSGGMLFDIRKLRQVVYAMIGCFCFSCIDFLLSDLIVDSMLMLIYTIFFVVGCIALLNIQMIHEDIDIFLGSRPSVNNDTSISDPGRRLDRLIQDWVQNPGKPYLKENLTLSIVAESINVSPRLLSEYLNTILDQNFNTWINSLRIDEVKRLIQEGRLESLTEIAYSVGFSDLAAMSKVFKRIEGITPKEYRSNFKTIIDEK